MAATPEPMPPDARTTGTRPVVQVVDPIHAAGTAHPAASPALRLVAKHGSGIDDIDVPAATARGALVANTPGGTIATAVAEGAATLMLATLRRVREMDALVRAGGFDRRWSITPGDLTGGRLGLVDEATLVAALGEGRIAGAGFDVLEQEPPQPDHPLFALPGVVLSPHVAGVTDGSMRGMALAVADLVDQVMAGRRPATAVNTPLSGEPPCSL